jgi:uncharacterized protein YbbK (DUF523 family)
MNESMITFSKKFMEKQENIYGFIMKNRSPSCGIGDVKVYSAEDSYFSEPKKTS